ncbi:hypothetical protein [Streptomyces vinaceus]|uniref:hypothetical protein n=1 Tax=Streptomyces vinaceus TaxID=1960 RepID=UPI0036B2AA2D
MTDRTYYYAMTVLTVVGFVMGEIWQWRRYGYGSVRELVRDRVSLAGGLGAGVVVLGFTATEGHLLSGVVPMLLVSFLGATLLHRLRINSSH